MSDSAGTHLARLRLPRPHLTGVIAMAFAAAFSTWLIVDRGDAPSITAVRIGPAAATAPPPPTTSSPTGALTVAQLQARVRSLGQPVYWAGAERGRSYELTTDTAGNVVVRYLPAGATAGGTEPTLRVATIPLQGAFAATQRLAGQPGAVSRTLVDGGLVYYRTDRPATYLAYPGVEYVIEIDDPSPARARRLVLAGRIRPVS